MNILGPFAFERLMNPWFVLLLLGVIALLIAETFKRAPGTLTVSTGETFARIGGNARAVLHTLPTVLRAVGLALLVVALARPLSGIRPHIERTKVVDIMLCVDVSGSMRAMDFMESGKPRDRLYVTKQAVQDFIESRKYKSEDRYGLDRLGLILYAGYAWTQTPLTLDYGILERDLDLAEIDESDRDKAGTAIGSAIGLAVGRLSKSEAESKVIVLLTDGRNNKGELDPLTAAQIASDYGIRIYTIGAGSGGEVLIPQQTIFGERLVPANIPMDEETLQKIAAKTDGRYYRATDTEALKEAYAEINQLEATEIEVGDLYDQDEAFVPWAVAGTLAIALSMFSRRMWFDPIP